MALYFSLLLALCCYVSFSYEAATGVKEASHDKKVVCYYTSWSHARKAPYGMTPDKIDPFLCTHVIYAFQDIGDKHDVVSADPEYDFDDGAYQKLIDLKKQNKDLKVMISIGGAKAGTTGFAKISSTEQDRQEFAKNAVKYLRELGFDGLDLNWQHPTFREGGKAEDKENYVLLTKALREEIDREAASSGKPKLLLAVSITHNQKYLPAYDLVNLPKYLDFVSAICYDYAWSHEPAVHHHAPLYAVENSDDSKSSTNYTINYFLEFMKPEKLVLGTPVYGRSFALKDLKNHDLGAPADGAAEKGVFTGEKGFYSYYEICNFVKNDGWNVVQSKPGVVGPYAYKGNQWVGYDDAEMARNKAKYVKEKGLAGIMFWTLDFDDFVNNCGGGKNPIITAARDELIGPKP